MACFFCLKARGRQNVDVDGAMLSTMIPKNEDDDDFWNPDSVKVNAAPPTQTFFGDDVSSVSFGSSQSWAVFDGLAFRAVPSK